MHNELAITFDNIKEVEFVSNKLEGKGEVEITHCGKTTLQNEGFNYKK